MPVDYDSTGRDSEEILVTPNGQLDINLNALTKAILTGGSDLRKVIDDVMVRGGMGKRSRVRDKQFSGFNHEKTAVNLPPAHDFTGHTFFVRPMLNLARSECLKVRQLAQLVTGNQMSMQMWARMTLDPLLAYEEYVNSPLVDNYNCFIPLLTNSLRSLSNVPDVTVGTRTTEKGNMKESFTYIDDTWKNYDTYSVSCSFRNMNGNPFLILFLSWLITASGSYLGTVNPRWSDRMQRRLNYTSRIYRITLDTTQTYVTNIWSPIYCFPTGVRVGNIFAYNVDKPINEEVNEVDVQFQCVGSIFNDALLYYQFNQVVGLANPRMRDDVINKEMVKLNKVVKPIFNYYGYPRINLETSELEWWVEKAVYKGGENLAKIAIERDAIAPPEGISNAALAKALGMNPHKVYPSNPNIYFNNMIMNGARNTSTLNEDGRTPESLEEARRRYRSMVDNSIDSGSEAILKLDD